MIGSPALNVLSGSLDAADALLLQDAELGDPAPKPTEPLVQGLRVGAAVIVVAAFEEYLRNAIQEHVGVLATDPPPLTPSDLPPALWITSVFESLQDALNGPRFGPQNERRDRLQAIRRASDLVVREQLDPGAVTYRHANPDSATVISTFKKIGLPGIFGVVQQDFESLWGQREPSRFAADKLDEIVRRRHVVAHTAYVLGIARTDLEESSRFIRALANCLDLALKRHIASIWGGSFAPTP